MKIDVPNLEFEAKFADETSQYSSLKQRPGIDGFEMPVDPLYKVCNNKINPKYLLIFTNLSLPQGHKCGAPNKYSSNCLKRSFRISKKS